MICPVWIANELSAAERTMKIPEVIMRAMARKITWYEPAEITDVIMLRESR